MENTETNNIEEKQVQTDIFVEEDGEQYTPQLFSEEENIDSFKQEIDTQNESESLIDIDDDEEDFEIPAFLRKQKN